MKRAALLLSVFAAAAACAAPLEVARPCAGTTVPLLTAGQKGFLDLPRDERVEMARLVTQRYPNVEVTTYDGLIAEYARTFPEGAVIVKGLRANTDFENEFQMALINKKINPDLDTMFLTATQKYTFLSSSVVKELASYGADLSPFVPCEIIDDVMTRAKTNL